MQDYEMSVVIVDNQPLFSIALSELFAEEAGTSITIKNDITEVETEVDVLLLSLDTNCLVNENRLQNFLSRFPNTKLLIIAPDCTNLNIQNLIELGAKGVILRTEAPESFITAARLVFSGKYYFCHPDIINQANFTKRKVSRDDFTFREKEILDLLVEGKTDKEIALSLNLAHQTVRNRLHGIYGKLNVGSRTEAILKL